MASEFEKINDEELAEAAGGKNALASNGEKPKGYKKVRGLQKGYLALRSAPGYEYSNEIGQLYNGDDVQVIGDTVYVSNDFGGRSTPYVKVYAPRLDKKGWVNKNFIH